MWVVGCRLKERMELTWKFAGVEDAGLLGEWNRQLIQDEGHRNPMSVDELTARMRGWLGGEYRGLIYSVAELPVGYALYRVEAEGIYLRHFFVCSGQRRRGCGREGFRILREEVWPEGRRLSVAALCRNAPAVAFWRALGFVDYCLTLELEPD